MTWYDLFINERGHIWLSAYNDPDMTRIRMWYDSAMTLVKIYES